MKYSILTLLGITAYVAAAIAAIARPLSFWNDFSCGLWIVVLLAMAIESIVAKPMRSTFCRSAIAFCMVYVATSFILHASAGLNVTGGNQWLYVDARPPHVALVHTWYEFAVSTEIPYGLYREHVEDFSDVDVNPIVAASPMRLQFVARERANRLSPALCRLAFAQVSLAFGLLGGSLALWRYRRNEKAHRESGGQSST